MIVVKKHIPSIAAKGERNLSGMVI